MIYEFNLADYWTTMDRINDRDDVDNYGFKQIKIAEGENSTLYAFGYRVVIPELKLTAREGVEYYQNEDGEEEPIDSYILYDGDEKDPAKFKDSYCNTFLPELVAMIAKQKKKNTNPKCFIDDAEFVFWED